MRIICGQYKQRRIICCKNNNARPTMDFIKENVFNIIGKDNVTNIKFLDLYAGTGSIGLEAYSRGAKCVSFVDNNINAINNIKYNLKKLNIYNNVFIYKQDAIKFIQFSVINKSMFDVIYIDPPYNYEYNDILCDIHMIMADNCLCIIESSKELNIENIKNLILIKYRKYSNKRLYFFRKNLNYV